MEEILLTSEDFIKEVSNISDNVNGKFILPSIREAQEQGLRGIIGDCLLAKLKDLVRIGEIDRPENAWYKGVIDRSQYYLAYTAIVELTNKVSYKIGNFGVTKTTDENLQVATWEEIIQQQSYYQAKADSYCLDLQNWILENRTHLPELSACQCNRIKATLHSSATCGLVLGGLRGKVRRR